MSDRGSVMVEHNRDTSVNFSLACAIVNPLMRVGANSVKLEAPARAPHSLGALSLTKTPLAGERIWNLLHLA
jgi:hypothetical protein